MATAAEPNDDESDSEAPTGPTEGVVKATELKAKGNEAFREQNFENARKYWGDALEALEGESGDGEPRFLRLTLNLNLAQVALKQEDWEAVVTFATDALGIEPESSKGLYRRGLARLNLGKEHIEDAVSDLHQAARHEPQNAEIRKNLTEARKRYKEKKDEEPPEPPPPEHDLDKLPRVFLDISVGDASPIRMEFALFTDSTPLTAENFKALCTGEKVSETSGKPLHFKGCIFHRIVPGLLVQGGDFTYGDGTGGESIYGRRFKDENFLDRHTRRGLLSMANNGIHTNSSQFWISLDAAPFCDKKHVVFGEVVSGIELLDVLEKLECDEEARPLKEVKITDCGDVFSPSMKFS